MSTQLAHVYNVNRNAVHSVNVIFTPLEGQLKQRMVEGRKGDYLRWKGLQVSEKPIEDLWSASEAPSVLPDTTEKQTEVSTSTQSEINVQTHEIECRIRKEDVIYLTADSEYTLSTLEEGKSYIIGGIVDHNKYKVRLDHSEKTTRLSCLADKLQNLCLGIAQKHGISHAALPITQYIEMSSRKVLTVNQCFEIMSKW